MCYILCSIVFLINRTLMDRSSVDPSGLLFLRGRVGNLRSSIFQTEDAHEKLWWELEEFRYHAKIWRL